MHIRFMFVRLPSITLIVNPENHLNPFQIRYVLISDPGKGYLRTYEFRSMFEFEFDFDSFICVQL